MTLQATEKIRAACKKQKSGLVLQNTPCTSPRKMATTRLAVGKTLTKRHGNVEKLSIVELFKSRETSTKRSANVAETYAWVPGPH